MANPACALPLDNSHLLFDPVPSTDVPAAADDFPLRTASGQWAGHGEQQVTGARGGGAKSRYSLTACKTQRLSRGATNTRWQSARGGRPVRHTEGVGLARVSNAVDSSPLTFCILCEFETFEKASHLSFHVSVALLGEA
eukprot:Selendium_serpulae@DN5633_c0_g1_i6.p1